MYPNRYFMPSMMRNSMMYANPNMLNFRGMGMFERLSNGIKTFNWKGLFSGVNKTLNTVNQTIPLIKQAKPMYDNVKSMVRLTKVFRNATGSRNATSIKQNVINKEKISNSSIKKENQPVFFI